jgi:hypothetical protein
MLVKITAPPSIVTEVTDYTAGPRWVAADKVRFRYSFPELIGGHSALNIADPILDVPRSLHAWRELDGLQNIAIGTASHLYTAQGGARYDITPLRADDDALGADPLDTTNLSKVVTVNHTTHGATDGDYVVLAGATAPGGIPASEINTEHQLTYVNANSYTITVATTAATSSVSGGGGSVLADYLISNGTTYSTYSYGWGASTWGASTWGTARSSSTLNLYARIWSMDNWGEDLVCTPGGGDQSIYLWDSSAGTGTRAAVISGPPSTVNRILVSEDRHLIAFGAHDGVAFDPMLIRWCDQEDYTTWTATSVNTAGDKLLNTGNQILAAEKARGHIIVLTDTAAWSMQFIGPPFTFGFQQIGDTCGAVGPKCLATVDSLGFWMGDDNFYIFDGTTQALECPVANHVFDDIDRTAASNVCATTLKEFNEVWWFYPSNGSQELDRYVIYNYKDKTWAIGTYERTAAIDRSIFSNPIWSDASGNLYYHEFGSNANGAALTGYIETGAFEVGQGDTLSFMDRLIPDTTLNSGKEIKITVYTKRYPNSTAITKGPYTVGTSTEKVSLRARARQYRFRFENSDLDNPWKLGVWRADIQPDGKR